MLGKGGRGRETGDAGVREENAKCTPSLQPCCQITAPLEMSPFPLYRCRCARVYEVCDCIVFACALAVLLTFKERACDAKMGQVWCAGSGHMCLLKPVCLFPTP
eukprot:RCo028935